MAVEIEPIQADRLADYAAVPMVCHVRSMLDFAPIDCEIDGSTLHEQMMPSPHMKDYDAIDGGPLTWRTRFDLTTWGLWLARDHDKTVGGAAVAWNIAVPSMHGDQRDIAVLWDIRVRPPYQLQGIGTGLFRTALEWARSKGCKTLKVETQNVNVAACRFYAKMGCTLSAVDRFAYRHRPQIADEVMLTWCLDL